MIIDDPQNDSNELPVSFGVCICQLWLVSTSVQVPGAVDG
jgi:hypothetical protein